MYIRPIDAPYLKRKALLLCVVSLLYMIDNCTEMTRRHPIVLPYQRSVGTSQYEMLNHMPMNMQEPVLICV
jgi:hypothetical protein